MRRYTVFLLVVAAGCAGTANEADTTTVPAPVSTTITAPPPASTTTTQAGPSSTSPAQPATTVDPSPRLTVEAFPVPPGSRPHDVAPALDGGVWYTAQGLGELGWLDPDTGETRHIDLGSGSRPHGVIVDAEGTPWITDGGLNAIVSVDPDSEEVTIHPLPDTSADANLNTAVFDLDGDLWFTGQAGIYAVLDVDDTGEMVVYEAPEGRGPYGITVTPQGTVFYASLAGSFVGEVAADGSTIVREPPTPGQGARRVWSDSMGAVWVSEWNSGNVSRYDPVSGEWDTWGLPGDASAYAVYVDEEDIVWLSDFTANAIVRFDPATDSFTAYALPHESGEVRQIHGRPGEIWGAESAADHLVLIETR